MVPLTPATLRHKRLRHRHRSGADRKNGVENLERFDVSSDVWFEAYWLTTQTTDGPACSAWAHGDEVWRVDLLAGEPHLHIAVTDARVMRSRYRKRLDLPPLGEGRDLVDFAIDFLRANFTAGLASSRRAVVRNLEVDARSVDSAIDGVAQHLHELVRQRS